MTLHWPTSLSINPLDDTLHVLDNHSVLKVTMEKTIVVVAGRPLHCPLDGKNAGVRGDKRKRDVGRRWKFSESNQFRRSTSSEFHSNFPNGDVEWQSGIEYDPSLNDDDDDDDDDYDDAYDDDGVDVDDDNDVLYDDEDLNDADGVVNDDGELAVNVRFKHPIHIAFSPAGDLYVVESNAKDVNRVSYSCLPCEWLVNGARIKTLRSITARFRWEKWTRLVGYGIMQVREFPMMIVNATKRNSSRPSTCTNPEKYTTTSALVTQILERVWQPSFISRTLPRLLLRPTTSFTSPTWATTKCIRFCLQLLSKIEMAITR